MAKVRISHRGSDLPIAERLAAELRSAGHRVWLDAWALRPGEAIVGGIEDGLGEASHVVLCYWPDGLDSPWLKGRLTSASESASASASTLACQLDGEEVRVVRVLLPGGVPPALPAGLKHVDLGKSWSSGVAELLRALDEPAPALSPEDGLGGREKRQWRDSGEAAELRYRDFALRTANLIDLAGLPDVLPGLAMTPELRRLYIPLRVKTVLAAEAAEAAGRRGGGPSEVESRRVPVGERLAAVRRLVVLGEPGAGKSTLVRWLAAAYLLRLRSIRDSIGLPDVATLPFDPLLPVVVSCRDLDAVTAAGPLDGVLRHTLRRAELSADETEALLARLFNHLQEGRVLLLFDSLDALGDLPVRASFIRQLEQVALAYPEAAIVVTSRPAGYRELGFRLSRSFEHVMITELARAEKESFARLWYRLTEPRPERRQRDTEKLIRAIHSTRRIERLAGNPMLLTTMALVMPEVGRLPQRRADLYWQVVELLLNRGAGEPLAPGEALPQLEYLSFAMCDQGVQQLAQTEILSLLEALRRELPPAHPVHSRPAGDFLRLLEERTGILRRAGERRHHGMTEPVFELCHLTFQEYLAARALVDGCFPGRDPQRSLAESVGPLAGRTVERPDGEVALSEHWREALRLCAALSGDAVDDVLLALLRPLPGESAATARPRAVLAALCLADEPEVGEAAARQVLDGLARQVREGKGNPLWRTNLDHAVRELAESRWAPQLRLALVREFCARAAKERWSLGFVFLQLAAISELEGPAGAAEPSAHAFANREEEGTAMALEAAGAAFAADKVAASELGERLLPLLAGSPATAHAAAWALYSLLGRHQQGDAWRPSAAQVERMTGLAARPDLDPGAAWCLSKILGRLRGIG